MQENVIRATMDLSTQRSYYIYYHSAASHAQQVVDCVLKMQEDLRLQHRIDGSLLRRPEVNSDVVTWMEVYRSAPEEADVLIAAAANSSGLMRLLQGARHIEIFVDVTPCA